MALFLDVQASDRDPNVASAFVNGGRVLLYLVVSLGMYLYEYWYRNVEFTRL